MGVEDFSHPAARQAAEDVVASVDEETDRAGFVREEATDPLEVRRRNLETVVTDPIRELARYMISEHFAAYFFLRLSRQAPAPRGEQS